jgi:hypothetical protein
LTLDSKDNFVTLLDLFDKNRLVLAMRCVFAFLLIFVRYTPTTSFTEGNTVARVSFHGPKGRRVPERAIAVNDIRGRKMRRNSKDA